MRRHSFTPCIVSAAVALTACVAAEADQQSQAAVQNWQAPVQKSRAVVQESGCRTGGDAVANAYVRANPIYAQFFGSLESFVANNAEHFRSGGDAVRCAAALSQAFLNRAIQLYDPTDQARQAELRAQLGAMGVSPGPQESTASGDAFGVSMALSRLARVLPAVADGDYAALQTPTNELEQMQIVAMQILQGFLGSPEMAPMLAQLEPMIRELANLEYRAIEQAAATLANSE